MPDNKRRGGKVSALKIPHLIFMSLMRSQPLDCESKRSVFQNDIFVLRYSQLSVLWLRMSTRKIYFVYFKGLDDLRVCHTVKGLFVIYSCHTEAFVLWLFLRIIYFISHWCLHPKEPLPTTFLLNRTFIVFA